jgi:uncharacterized membrane protein
MLHHFFESHGRSILKALSWKLIATLLSFFVLYAETGSFAFASKLSWSIFVIGLMLYYLHERLWNGIHWGKEHHNHEHHA